MPPRFRPPMADTPQQKIRRRPNSPGRRLSFPDVPLSDSNPATLISRRKRGRVFIALWVFSLHLGRY